MTRVYEAWSPEHSRIVIERKKDAQLIMTAFQDAVSTGAPAATELYDRRLSPQVPGEKDELAELTFDTSESSIVVGVLAAYARDLPGYKFLERRRAVSLIGLTAVHARHEFSVSNE